MSLKPWSRPRDGALLEARSGLRATAASIRGRSATN